jgi:hypothetical protein
MLNMEQKPHRTRVLASPASLALASLGYGHTSLAAPLGVTRRAVGLYLSGARGLHPGLPDALRSLVGDDHARRILELIPSRDAQADRAA